MNALQEAKLNMYRSLELHCDNNNILIATNVAFNDSFTLFKKTIAGILTTTADQKLKINGLTNAKSTAKQNLCTNASEVAGIIYAFATTSADEDMQAKVSYSYSELLRQRDDILVPICANILTIANDNLAALASYGITAATITALQTAMDTYSASVPANKTARSERQSSGASLKQLFKDADALLKKRMDKLVTVFADTGPAFVATYKNARTIIGPAYRKTIKKAVESKDAA